MTNIEIAIQELNASSIEFKQLNETTLQVGELTVTITDEINVYNEDDDHLMNALFNVRYLVADLMDLC